MIENLTSIFIKHEEVKGKLEEAMTRLEKRVIDTDKEIFASNIYAIIGDGEYLLNDGTPRLLYVEEVFIDERFGHLKMKCYEVIRD